MIRGFGIALFAAVTLGRNLVSGQALPHVSLEGPGADSDDWVPDFRLASKVGLGLIPSEIDLNNDAEFELTAAACLRTYALLAVKPEGTPDTDAPRMPRLIAALVAPPARTLHRARDRRRWHSGGGTPRAG